MDYLPRGASVGRFVIIERIGAGGMAVVYAAYDPELDRKVAIKLLHSRTSAGSSRARGRLLREAQAMARVSHPNVIVVYDVGTLGDEVFLAEELVEGMTLWAWMQQRRRGWREVLDVFVPAGRGLAAAHAAGVIHRDFKPPNVLISADGRVRVTDFGLARAVDEPRADATPTPVPRKAGSTAPQVEPVSPHAETIDVVSDGAASSSDASARPPASSATPISPDDQTVDVLSETHVSGPGGAGTGPSSGGAGTGPSSGGALSAPMTEAGALVGTPLYMAPEQHARERVDARTDQWSYCVSLWQALYGEAPFKGDNIEELAAAVKAGAPKPPDGSDVPDWVRRVIVRGLGVSPDQRYPSMDALLDDLARDPAIVRRRRIAIAAIVVLPAAAATLALALAPGDQAAPSQLCVGGEAELAGVWDDARRRDVATAFAAVHTPLAGPAAETITRTLDRWRTDYSRMHREACEATRIRGTQSEELLDRRMVCLAQRRQQVSALVELLANANAKLVERSVEAVQHVTELATCADLAALSAPLPRPAASLAPKVELLRVTLARAKALEEAGHYPDGVALARGVVTEARPLGYGPVLAEALLQCGSLEAGAGNYPAAEELLFEAFYQAEALRYDDVAARAATELVDVVGFRRSRFDEAHRLARHAEAIITRRGGYEQLRARLDSHVGGVYRAERKLDEAMARQQAGAARFEKLYGANSPEVARARLNIGNVLAQKGDLAGALGEFQQALRMFAAALGERHPAVALCHNNIANIHYMESRYAEALVEYRAARAIYEAALGPDHPDVGMARMNTALVLHGTAKHDEAREEFLAAIAIDEKAFGAGSPQVAGDRANLGMLYVDMKRFSEAVAEFERALAIQIEALGPAHLDVAWSRTELAFALAHAGRAADAIELAEQALAARKAQPDNVSEVEVARSEFALAVALWKSRRDRQRALALGKSTRTRLVAAGDAGKMDLAALDDWYTRDVGRRPQ